MSTTSTLTKEIIEKWRDDPTDYVGQLTDVKALVGHYTPIFHSFGVDDEAKAALIAHVTAATTSTPSELRLGWLQLLRILFRDKECADLAEFATAARFLVGYARLASDDEGDSPVFDAMLLMEAEKVLSNLVFNSEKARITFRELAAVNLLRRINFVCARLSDGGGGDEAPTPRLAELTSLSAQTLWELLFFDMKIAFIISAHMRSVQKDWVEDTDATATFIRVLVKAAGDLKEPLAQQTAVQALNVLYNLYCHAQIFDVDVATSCARECAKIVGGGARHDFDFKQASVNVLALMPTVLGSLCPAVTDNANKEACCTPDSDVFEGCDIRFAKDILAAFEEAIEKLANANESNFLTMFFKALIGLCTGNKAARRYCRLKILPPLTAREVQRPPDEGDALRNKIVRLMKGPSEVSQASAEFVYVLCKRSESRMMKYCGFGHAAGLFANRGLLGAAATAQKSASDSEDSETEDYAGVEEKVNPITGFIPSVEHVEAIRRQLESMTEEQKEYEAMKLANAMNKLMDEGVFKPATVGADGRPRELSHVAELVKDIRPEEEKDSDDEK